MISQFLQWAPWLAGGGVIVWIVLALLAPSVLQVAASWLTSLSPLIKGLADLVVWFFRDILWEGFKDMSDNAASILFVATVATLAAMWVAWNPYCPERKFAGKAPSCETCIKNLRRDYKFVPRKPAVKQQSLPTLGWPFN